MPWRPISLIAPGTATDTSGPEEVRDVLAPIAANHDATLPQDALAWLLAVDPAVLPIPATTGIRHFRENVSALDLELTTEERARITDLP
ncbi:aldo/keto reductase [Frankia sp. AgB32]|uniref:aldo/keto reductase n=1 Tax=Frankia sp. AgB32 TaxID=631119 RepID=UPI00200C3630|nr:aldo/keto reductase [Frankia sp. AgB32]